MLALSVKVKLFLPHHSLGVGGCTAAAHSWLCRVAGTWRCTVSRIPAALLGHAFAPSTLGEAC